MPLTKTEMEKMNKEIANRVYAEGLKFKEEVANLRIEISALRNKLHKVESSESYSAARAESLERECRLLRHEIMRTVNRTPVDNVIFGTNMHKEFEKLLQTSARDVENTTSKFGPSSRRPSKGYRAPDDWEQIVQRYHNDHPRNRVASLIADEPGKDAEFPVRHGKLWTSEEDEELNRRLANFLVNTAKYARRNPSSIAFRVIRQLKYMGIELS
jgi:hypothetical protein